MRLCISADGRDGDSGGPIGHHLDIDVAPENLPAIIERLEDAIGVTIEGPKYYTFPDAKRLVEPAPGCVHEYTIVDPVYVKEWMAENMATKAECWLLWGRSAAAWDRVEEDLRRMRSLAINDACKDAYTNAIELVRHWRRKP